MINGNCTGSVTATLTWIPAFGKTLQSDPPAKMVSIIETSFATDDPGTWGGEGPAPMGVGSASDGLDDSQVPYGNGYSSSGSHRVRKDGSSGTITLGPFTLTATCPVSSYVTQYEIIGESPLLSYEYHSWDWMGGLGEVGFGVKVVPSAHPVNFRCTSASAEFNGELKYVYAWESSTGILADLAETSCIVKERVSYEGNSTGTRYEDNNGNMVAYSPPLPFVARWANPEIYGNTPGADGYTGDTHHVPPISPSYQYATFTASQKYIYTDDIMDPNNPNDYVTLRGPIDIVRTVWAPDIDWFYTIIKYDAPDAFSGTYKEAQLNLGPVYPQFGP